jgi:hypothetical protein
MIVVRLIKWTVVLSVLYICTVKLFCRYVLSWLARSDPAGFQIAVRKNARKKGISEDEFMKRLRRNGFVPPPPADDLAVLRRMVRQMTKTR